MTNLLITHCTNQIYWQKPSQIMQIETFLKHLAKLQQGDSNFQYQLGQTLSASDIEQSEHHLSLIIPSKVKDFYLFANGLKTSSPSLEIIAMQDWVIKDNHIHFATFDHSINVYFSIQQLNVANEWTIINLAENYNITLSISSFWSNKIWHWLRHRKKIWADNWWLDS